MLFDRRKNLFGEAGTLSYYKLRFVLKLILDKHLSVNIDWFLILEVLTHFLKLNPKY